jgi:putative component of toxin-antitoxin plasmid stabilization module
VFTYPAVVEIIRSATFDKWLSGLKDARGRARVLVRIDRLAGGDKSTQASDIATAKSIAEQWKE